MERTPEQETIISDLLEALIVAIAAFNYSEEESIKKSIAEAEIYLNNNEKRNLDNAYLKRNRFSSL